VIAVLKLVIRFILPIWLVALGIGLMSFVVAESAIVEPSANSTTAQSERQSLHWCALT
jgi:hypothetical protein